MKVTVESAFLKATDVEDGALITFTNEGEEKPSPFKTASGQTKTQFNIGVKLENGDEKVLTLNNTSKANMIEAYGDESKAWIGKQARVHIKEENVSGEFKDVMYLTHPNKDLKGNELNF